MGSQRHRIRLGQSAAMQCHLAVGIAELRAQMPAVNLGQLQPGHMPQPQKERQPRIGGILVQTAGDVQERFLKHVRIVDPPLQVTA
jgi:hypothetical protein